MSEGSIAASATAAAARLRADLIAAGQSEGVRARYLEAAMRAGAQPSQEAVDLAALVACAYPAIEHQLAAHPHDAIYLVKSGSKTPRDARTYRRLLAAQLLSPTNAHLKKWSPDDGDEERTKAVLRRFSRREKMRIALREVQAGAANTLETTAREISDLADALLEAALTHARAWAEARYGTPVTTAGTKCSFVILGMGKLGGRELNAGSDVDLLLVYETDDGDVQKDGVATDQTLHEHFSRVAQKLTVLLDEATEDGIAWRVDLRLRPEGSRGPLVNALAAAERYYEAWGRTWERAALLRARPCAGDLALGEAVLGALSSFIWRRTVDPRIAREMAELLERGRAELTHGPDADRDLKLGEGGIREAEFFVQSLALVWGGREPSVRAANTLVALRRLRARGLVSDREAGEISDAYVLLRRVEHRVQFATQQQTHVLPRGDLLERIARSLDYESGAALERTLASHRTKVKERFRSLLAENAGTLPHEEALEASVQAALDRQDEGALGELVGQMFGGAWTPELARYLLALAARPNDPLGSSTRDRVPTLGPVLLEALATSADPEQAARCMATFFRRVSSNTTYARALADDPRAARRLAGLFGASVFLANGILARPELADRLLFGSGAPDEASARAAVDEEVTATNGQTATVNVNAQGEELDEADRLAGALRRAKGRVTLEIGLADLAGETTTTRTMQTLSALAEVTLEHATSFALAERKRSIGLAVMAMGALGGRSLGYGSDLDLFFVFREEDDETAHDAHDDVQTIAVRVAQRVLRLVGAPNGDGPGYELDTRLRPSGNQGLLVVSRNAFARYHRARRNEGGDGAETDPGPQAEAWERQALIKARFVAGDEALGREVEELAARAAYEQSAPDPQAMHTLRLRMERELGRERRGTDRDRYDVKTGRGGLVDVEFAAQFLQMKHGLDKRVRTSDTILALQALEGAKYLDSAVATTLRNGYRSLRHLELRLRVLHASSVQSLEEGVLGMGQLARRMGLRGGPMRSATAEMFDQYRATTREVRAAYLAALGLPDDAEASASIPPPAPGS